MFCTCTIEYRIHTRNVIPSIKNLGCPLDGCRMSLSSRSINQDDRFQGRFRSKFQEVSSQQAQVGMQPVRPIAMIEMKTIDIASISPDIACFGPRGEGYSLRDIYYRRHGLIQLIQCTYQISCGSPGSPFTIQNRCLSFRRTCKWSAVRREEAREQGKEREIRAVNRVSLTRISGVKYSQVDFSANVRFRKRSTLPRGETGPTKSLYFPLLGLPFPFPNDFPSNPGRAFGLIPFRLSFLRSFRVAMLSDLFFCFAAIEAVICFLRSLLHARNGGWVG